MAFQLDLLAVASDAGALGLADFACGHHRADDGEEGGQAEVAAEVPPQASAAVGKSEHVKCVWESCGDSDYAMFARYHLRRLTLLFHQLPDEELGQGEEQSTQPDHD